MYAFPSAGHLHYFQFGAIINKAAIIVHGQVLCERKFLFLWDKCSRVLI